MRFFRKSEQPLPFLLLWGGMPLYHVDRVVRETGRIVDNGFEEKFPLTSASKHRYRETEEGQQIMCEIMERLNTEAREEGRDEMRDEINALNIRLINENRLDDLHRAATDIEYQAQLINELFPKKTQQ